ncbi:SDR family NAD(P)-dependent oxidoreductase [Herbidospora mongoliensis]|uniref:SDR family NAD(P)-dependent oxidoreductase n=1 Tax=Herbidospora mongoliensis TaxID=688067 RepID=UPI00082CBC4D|nr:SDR family NAD(P)-dependent oxidoreductase [Herbidospora mongoliensis]
MRAVVTGGASGIGYETALGLARAGAEVTIAVRNPESGLVAAERIREATGWKVAVGRLDLADLASVREFVSGWDGPLDVLVNNAGIMALPELTRTGEGWELQFATNHVGHAALTIGLRPAMPDGGRIVVVASAAHLMSPVHFDDLHFERRAYDPWQAYAQSKTANILFAVGAARRWPGLFVNAAHPGGIMTNLQRHLDDAQLTFVGAKDEQGNVLEVPPGWKTPEQGASTSLLLALGAVGVTGRYFADDREVPVGPSLADYAVDPAQADRLWEETARLLG